MKKNIVNIIIGLLVVGVGFLYYAQFDKDIKVAYIDVNVLLSEYKGMQDAQVEFQKRSKVWQSNVDTLIAGWTSELKKYEKERSSMSDKEKQLKEELLANKQQQINQYQQGVQQKTKDEENKMTQTVINEINEYIEVFGERHQYKYILGANASGNILYADDNSDLTKEVLQGLNEQYNNGK